VSRVLFVVPPLAGHINPAAAVGGRLVEAGHTVAWAAAESVARPVLGPDATVYPTGLRLYRPLDGADVVRTFLEGYVLPLARFTLDAVRAAADDFRPDVMAVDQHAVAGALVARGLSLPWASLVPASMGLTQATDPALAAWARGPLAPLWARAGLSGEPTADVLFSPHLQIGFTTRALLGDAAIPAPAVLVGPALAERRDEPPFPWDRLDPHRRLVLVTMGTLNPAADFLGRVADALAPLGDRLQAVLVAPPDALPDPPDHLVVVDRAPVLRLMSRVDAVVSHGGMNTVAEALAHGVPLVVAPITLDQPTTAEQVAAAGAGVRVDFERVTPASVREAVLSVLDDPRYRRAAEGVRDSFAAAGGATAAAAHIARLAP
jgi:MGT family glycosyltransferase